MTLILLQQLQRECRQDLELARDRGEREWEVTLVKRLISLSRLRPHVPYGGLNKHCTPSPTKTDYMTEGNR